MESSLKGRSDAKQAAAVRVALCGSSQEEKEENASNMYLDFDNRRTVHKVR
jgi:hypothetical protein